MHLYTGKEINIETGRRQENIPRNAVAEYFTKFIDTSFDLISLVKFKFNEYPVFHKWGSFDRIYSQENASMANNW